MWGEMIKKKTDVYNEKTMVCQAKHLLAEISDWQANKCIDREKDK